MQKNAIFGEKKTGKIARNVENGYGVIQMGSVDEYKRKTKKIYLGFLEAKA